MPFEPPSNNTKSGNSENLYVLANGSSTIDGSLEVTGTLQIDQTAQVGGNVAVAGSLSGGTLAVPAPLNVSSGLVNTVGSVSSAVSVPQSISIAPTIYSCLFPVVAGAPIVAAPLTFTPPLPLPSEVPKGLYQFTGFGVAGLTYSYMGQFVNNGLSWVGCASDVSQQQVLFICTQTNGGNGTPFLAINTGTTQTQTIAINFFKIMDIPAIIV
jgi:hypothetical protein